MLKHRFEELDVIARGGMARVIRIRDTLLGREHAMKCLLPFLANQPEEVERFLEEAQVTAQLVHPNIPAVHAVGVTEDGRQFFTMSLVEGVTFESLLDEHAFDPSDEQQLFRALQVFLKVCDAVSFAHSRGVVHCDLKPANVMVGDHGQVYVMDWGIAQLAVDRPHQPPPPRAVVVPRKKPRMEPPNKIFGTLGYLAPEQARATQADIDERSDVFSLGALLYRIVVGQTIYPCGHAGEALARAMFAYITPPERAAPGRVLPKRLCAIALKAMNLEKDQRHASVAQLREEVEGWLGGLGRHPTRTFAPGELILQEGEPGESAFVIQKGRVQVFKHINGRHQVLAEMVPGAIFGEAAIFTSRGRTASVEAVEETTVVEISRASLEEELAGTPVMGDLVRVLANRFHELDAQARTLRERLDDWALHATVMTHFALHGETAEGSQRQAPWSPLKQVLVQHLDVPEERAEGSVLSLRGVRIDKAQDRITFSIQAAPQATTLNIPELSPRV